MHHLSAAIASTLGATATPETIRAEVDKVRLSILRRAKKMRKTRGGAETLYEKVSLKRIAEALEEQARLLLLAQFEIETEVLSFSSL